MIQIDESKVRHVTEPGCFGNPSIDFDCITLEYAHDLVREANIEIKELYRQIAAGDNEKITEKIPLTLQNVCSVVAAFTRLPAGKVLEYGKKVFEDNPQTLFYFQKKGTVQLTDVEDHLYILVSMPMHYIHLLL